MLPLGDSRPNEAVVGLKPLIGVTPLLGNSRSFPGLMDVKVEKPTYASVASPTPATDGDRSAAFTDPLISNLLGREDTSTSCFLHLTSYIIHSYTYTS